MKHTHIFSKSLMFFFLFNAYILSDEISFGHAIIGDATREEICDDEIFINTTDNGQQAIIIQGRKPAAAQKVMLYSFVKIEDPYGEFTCKVDYSNLQNNDAMVGLMLREPGGENEDYAAAGYTRERYIDYRYSTHGEVGGVNPCGYEFENFIVYIKVVIGNKLAKFYIAPQPYQDISDWRWIGKRFYTKNNTLVGVCLSPGK